MSEKTPMYNDKKEASNIIPILKHSGTYTPAAVYSVERKATLLHLPKHKIPQGKD